MIAVVVRDISGMVEGVIGNKYHQRAVFRVCPFRSIHKICKLNTFFLCMIRTYDFITEAGPDCREVNICGPFAECISSPDSRSYVCNCLAGFVGDGVRCSPEQQGTEDRGEIYFRSVKC